MKKFLTMVVAAMMATGIANAQEGYDDTKHEVAVSAGILSTSQYLDVFEAIINSIVGAQYKDGNFTGPLSAEYFYHAKNWLGVGGIFVFGKDKQDMYVLGSKAGDLTHSYYTLMPAVKFDWLRLKNFGMYSKLGIGATLRSESLNSNTSSNDNDSSSDIHFNWQVSALGFEAGSPKIRAFLELGFGEQGVGLIGLRCKF